MTTYVAFLRAINLGARRRFDKAAVIAATQAAGFSGIETHLNTGNVRVDSRLRSRERVEAALEAAYLADRGFEVPTIAFRADELAAVAEDAEQFGAEHGGAHFVTLLKQAAEPEGVAAVEERATARERVFVRGRALHLLVPGEYRQTALGNNVIERHLGPATTRNLTVVRTLAEKWC